MKQYEKEWLEKVDNLIDVNVHQKNYSINDLAFNLNISMSSLNRKLYKLTRTTPYNYIRKKRLEKIKEVLRLNSHLNLKIVGKKYGYKTSSYLKNIFEEKQVIEVSNESTFLDKKMN